jgi:hypothetical protein
MAVTNESKIYLDLIDTATSSYYYRKYKKEIKAENPGIGESELSKQAKKLVAESINFDIRFQALLYGKIALSDSNVFNNFLFPEMDEKDFEAFCGGADDIFVVHHRDFPAVFGLYAKNYNIRDYWSIGLQERVKNAGIIMGKDKYLTFDSDTGASLIKKLKEYDNGIDRAEDFPVFENFLLRCDKFVSSLSKESYIGYGNGPTTHDIMRKSRKKLKDKLSVFKSFFGNNNSAVLTLEAKIAEDIKPNFSEIEQLCKNLAAETDKLKMNDRQKQNLKDDVNDFFIKNIHENVSIVGLASQHNCTSLERVYGTTEAINGGVYLSIEIPSAFFNDLCKMSWAEYVEILSNPEIDKARGILRRVLGHTDKLWRKKE